MSVRLQKYSNKKTGKTGEHWIVDVVFEHPDGRLERVRKVSPVQTRRGAEQYERDVRDRLLLGKRRREAVEAPTLAAFADKFIETYAKANNKPSEVHTKERLLRVHLLPVLGRRRLDDVATQDVEAYKAQKRETHGAKTINNHLAVLRTLYEVAQEWGVVDKAPRIVALKTSTPDMRWLTDEELSWLLDVAGENWRTMFLVGARTGLRQGELRALRWVDIDLRGGRLSVRQAAWTDKIGTPKGGRSREVPLCEEVRLALEAHPRQLRAELVFPEASGGLRPTDQCMWAMRRSSGAASLEDVGWHTLRHTFASQLVIRGVALPTVQKLLGHADIRTTMRYAHLAPGAMAEAVRVFDVLPGGKLTANARSAAVNG